MVLLLKALTLFKREINTKGYKILIYLGLGLLLSMTINVLVDTFLPWSYLFNCLRAILGSLEALLLFFLGYGLFFIKGIYLENSFIMKYNAKQRINLAIIVYMLSLLLFMIFIQPGIRGYTIFVGILLSIWLLILLYLRPTFKDIAERK